MQQEQNQRTARRYRIELVDNWHKNWPAVLKFVESKKQRDALMVDEDGWLSARQVLFVAFNGSEVAGFLCFRVQPVCDDEGQPVRKDNRAVLEAKIDGFAVDGKFNPTELQEKLFHAARSRALELNCRHFRG